MSRSGDDEMSEQLNEASTEAGADAAERRFAPSTDAPAPSRGSRATGEPIFDVRDVHVYYGEHRAIRDVSMQIAPARDHRADRPVGVRQVHVHPVPEPHERPDPERPRGRRDRLPRAEPVRQRGRPRAGAQAHRHGLPEAEPVPEVDLRQHRLRPAGHGDEGRPGRDRRVGAAPRGAVGRDQGPPEDERLRHVRRPAAAPVHRPRARHRARRAADGRALLGPGPDLDRADRGPDDASSSRTTRSSSSPTTCSRRRACPT